MICLLEDYSWSFLVPRITRLTDMGPLLCGKFFILSQLKSYCKTWETHKAHKYNTKHKV